VQRSETALADAQLAPRDKNLPNTLLLDEEVNMKLTEIDMRSSFEVLSGTDRSQAVTMVLQPGTSTGGPNNRHERSDQWLLVTSGRGKAIVEGEEHELHEGSLLLIEAREAHEIANDGESPLETLNFYAPPVY
jgi:mannose-6-phosphate isomerase-like protein (cupin superfamily)